MKKTHLLLTTLTAIASVGVFALAGCSGDDSASGDDTADTGVVDSGPGPDGSTPDTGPTNPAPPTLGDQIDRMGRPAINTALNHSFDINATAKGAAKDAYNQDQGVAGWPAAYGAQIGQNLGIFDSLDTDIAGGGICTIDVPGCGCGNQLAFGPGSNGYGALAGVLGDDRLYVNTAGTTCQGYLAVEANATNIEPNSDCGGRRPNDDVIDTTYKALVGTTFGDGIAAPADVTAAVTAFPYLPASH